MLSIWTRLKLCILVKSYTPFPQITGHIYYTERVTKVNLEIHQQSEDPPFTLTQLYPTVYLRDGAFLKTVFVKNF